MIFSQTLSASGLFELVLFTAALPVYAQPVIDRIEREVTENRKNRSDSNEHGNQHSNEKIDESSVFSHRLFRSSTVSYMVCLIFLMCFVRGHGVMCSH